MDSRPKYYVSSSVIMHAVGVQFQYTLEVCSVISEVYGPHP